MFTQRSFGKPEDTGLPGAEPAVPDDHLGVRGAKCLQAKHLSELVRDQSSEHTRQPGVAVAHRKPSGVTPVI